MSTVAELQEALDKARAEIEDLMLQELAEEYKPGPEDFVHHWVYCVASKALEKK